MTTQKRISILGGMARAILLSFVLLIGSASYRSSLPDEPGKIERSFSLLKSAREIVPFTVEKTGIISAVVTWGPANTEVAVILNGPGQTSFYARKDGKNPLTLTYTVTEQDLKKGKDWRISVTNFVNPKVEGKVKVEFPADLQGAVTTLSVAFQVDKGGHQQGIFNAAVQAGDGIQVALPVLSAPAWVEMQFNSAVPLPQAQAITFNSPTNKPLSLSEFKSAYEKQIDADKATRLFWQGRIILGNQVLLPKNEPSNSRYFVFELPVGKATPMLKLVNISKVTLEGKWLIKISDKAKRDQEISLKLKQELDNALTKMENPEFVHAYFHTMNRHLKGYPGGKAGLDLTFDKLAKEMKIRPESFQILANRYQMIEPAIQQKLLQTKSNLGKTPIQQPIDGYALLKKPALAFKIPLVPYSAPENIYYNNILGKVVRIESWYYKGQYLTCGLDTRGKGSIRTPGYGLMLLSKAYNPMEYSPFTQWSYDEASVFQIVEGLGNSRNISFKDPLQKSSLLYIGERGQGEINMEAAIRGDVVFDFKIVPALNGMPYPWVSIQSVKNPGRYLVPEDAPYLPAKEGLRAVNSHIAAGSDSLYADFKNVATFRITEIPESDFKTREQKIFGSLVTLTTRINESCPGVWESSIIKKAEKVELNFSIYRSSNPGIQWSGMNPASGRLFVKILPPGQTSTKYYKELSGSYGSYQVSITSDMIAQYRGYGYEWKAIIENVSNSDLKGYFSLGLPNSAEPFTIKPCDGEMVSIITKYPGGTRVDGDLGVADSKTSSVTESGVFRAVPGLADSRYVSFEDAANPGNYINARDFPFDDKLYVGRVGSSFAQKQNATFKIVPGDIYPRLNLQRYDSEGLNERILKVGKFQGGNGTIECRILGHDYGSPIALSTSLGKTDEEYAIWINSLTSHRCADDIGPEIGCDQEEPYVIWTLFGPGIQRQGVATRLSDINQGETTLFKGDVEVFPFSNVFTPLVFIYQVAEDDPGGPNPSEVVEAIYHCVKFALALYSFNVVGIVEYGIKAVLDIVNIAAKLAGGGDDIFDPYVTVFSREDLLQMTSGKAKIHEKKLTTLCGDYELLSFRCAEMDSGWTFRFSVARKEQTGKNL